jgi:hypothetical protein
MPESHAVVVGVYHPRMDTAGFPQYPWQREII